MASGERSAINFLLNHGLFRKSAPTLVRGQAFPGPALTDLRFRLLIVNLQHQDEQVVRHLARRFVAFLKAFSDGGLHNPMQRYRLISFIIDGLSCQHVRHPTLCSPQLSIDESATCSSTARSSFQRTDSDSWGERQDDESTIRAPTAPISDQLALQSGGLWATSSAKNDATLPGDDHPSALSIDARGRGLYMAGDDALLQHGPHESCGRLASPPLRHGASARSTVTQQKFAPPARGTVSPKFPPRIRPDAHSSVR